MFRKLVVFIMVLTMTLSTRNLIAEEAVILGIYDKGNKGLVVYDDDKKKTKERLIGLTQTEIEAARLMVVAPRLVQVSIRERIVWLRKTKLQLSLTKLPPCPKSVVSVGEEHVEPTTHGVAGACEIEKVDSK